MNRVPTKENLADLPSRESYQLLLQKLKAVRDEPILEAVFSEADAWKSLSIVALEWHSRRA